MAAGDLITADMQIEWRATLLGAGTPYGWAGLTGWVTELPGMRLSDQPRPFRHGDYAGQQLSDERVITFNFQMHSAYAPFAPAVDTLRTITAVEEAPDEEPLVIQLAGVKWRANARCTRRSLPVDRQYIAQKPTGALQWVATDPRLYSADLQTVSVGLPQTGSGGLVFPLVFPLTFGAGLAGGNMSLNNAGTITTWPVWNITGPVTGPVITNVDTGDVLSFDPAFTISAGQTLVIDTDAKTVLLAGVNRRSSLFTAGWFGLKKGTTNVRFTSAGAYDPAALLTAQWRHATI